MARILAVCACLLAIMTMAGAMPGQALVAEAPVGSDVGLRLAAVVDPRGEPFGGGLQDDGAAAAPGKGQACMNADDDGGFGGSSASCKFACGPGALVAIGVKATDPDAWTYGNGSCDTADAACAMNAPVCTGVSDEVSQRAGAGGCGGSSDEFVSSPLLVACIATVPGPDVDPNSAVEEALQVLCDYSDICPSEDDPRPCGDVDSCDLKDVLCERLARIHSCEVGPIPFEVYCEGGCLGLVTTTCEAALGAAGGAGERLQAALDRLRPGDGLTAILSDATATAAFMVEPDASCTFTATY